MDAVNLDYIASVINPSDHQSRQSTMEDISVALSNSKVTYLLTSNSSGNVGLYAFPDNPT